MNSNQRSIFDKFVRAKNANRINVTGTGLGLFVAQKMVLLLRRYTLWVDCFVSLTIHLTKSCATIFSRSVTTMKIEVLLW